MFIPPLARPQPRPDGGWANRRMFAPRFRTPFSGAFGQPRRATARTAWSAAVGLRVDGSARAFTPLARFGRHAAWDRVPLTVSFPWARRRHGGASS